MNRTKSNSSQIVSINRRDFLKSTAIGTTGILLGFHVACRPKPEGPTPGGPLMDFSPNVFLNIDNRGTVSIIAHRSEFGQGVRTSLPQIVADELEADWTKVKIVQAEGDEEKYGNQNTDGSFSIRMFYEPMRRAGAAARMMLEQAAAQHWGVDVSECKAENHLVVHTKSSKRVEFARLAELVGDMEPPKDEDIKLKDKSEFKYIGKGIHLVDLEDITQGKAVYGMDVKRDGMKIAMIQRCPVAGGKVRNLDDSKATAIEGVQKVFTIASPAFPTGLDKSLGGVVVVADDTWAAMKGRKALEIEWDEGKNKAYNSESYTQELERRSKRPGNIQREQGDIQSAFLTAGKVLESTYSVPHLAHASMETPCALADVNTDAGTCELWVPTQHPQWVRGAVAGALGMDVKNVKVNVTLIGGGFGRKSKPDFSVEAALISKEMGMPIKLIWTREDDIQHDFYHALSVQHVRVAMDDDKQVTAWNHRTVYPPIGGTVSPLAVEPDAGELGLGFIDLPLNLPNICLETQQAEAQTRIGWLRSVCNIQHAFAISSMIDEIAEARDKDPVDNMLELLGDDRTIDFKALFPNFQNYGEALENYPWNTARLRGVIELVRDKSGWGKELPAGSGMGFAAHRSFLTYVSCVVQVTVSDDGRIKIDDVHYGVDCGLVVNPDTVRNQFEGGAVFASSIALKSKISLKNGRVEQSNFDTYQLARMEDAPANISVHLMESDEKPTGVGEPPVPPFIPALTNAIYAATGKRVRQLPIDLAKLS